MNIYVQAFLRCLVYLDMFLRCCFEDEWFLMYEFKSNRKAGYLPRQGCLGFNLALCNSKTAQLHHLGRVGEFGIRRSIFEHEVYCHLIGRAIVL